MSPQPGRTVLSPSPGFAAKSSFGHFKEKLNLVQLASIVGGLALWEVIALGFSPFVLPGPTAVAQRLFDPSFTVTLLQALGYSLTAMLLGLALAFSLAVPLGMLMGRLPRLNAMVDPVINALYAIPSVAFVPFLVIWLGLFFEARVALIFIMSFPDIIVVIIGGARDIRRNLIDVGRSFGASRLQLSRLVLFPAMMPFVLTGLRIGLARAINGMITAELFFAAINLGAIMKSRAQSFDAPGVLSVIVLICALGLLAQSLVGRVEGRLLKWHLRK